MTTEFLASAYGKNIVPHRESARAVQMADFWPASRTITDNVLLLELAAAAARVFPAEGDDKAYKCAWSILVKIYASVGKMGYDIATRQVAAHTDKELKELVDFTDQDIQVVNEALKQMRRS